MAEENIALVRFVRGWEQNGTSKDGMPSYRETIHIIKEVPPLTRIKDPATEEDFEQFPEAYKRFQREDKSRAAVVSSDGYPLALWPAIDQSLLQMCSARDIYTVEQLAKLAKRKDLPGELAEVADRAAQMIEHQKNIGKFEAIVRQKDGEISALLEQVRELRNTVAGRDAMIQSLRSMNTYVAPQGGTVHG
jgi:hypothetical protein